MTRGTENIMIFYQANDFRLWIIKLAHSRMCDYPLTEESGQRARQPNRQAVGVETKIRVGIIGHIFRAFQTRNPTVVVCDPFTVGHQ